MKNLLLNILEKSKPNSKIQLFFLKKYEIENLVTHSFTAHAPCANPKDLSTAFKILLSKNLISTLPYFPSRRVR